MVSGGSNFVMGAGNSINSLSPEAQKELEDKITAEIMEKMKARMGSLF